MERFIRELPIEAPDQEAADAARARWNSLAKPVGSLGELEHALVRIAALTGDDHLELRKRCVVVFCADNGVVAQGVSQSGADVTRVIARNAVHGVSSINKMCEPMGVDCITVDVGMLRALEEPGLINRRIAAGTGDISCGPAMSRTQALGALRAGVEIARDLAQQGYRIIATGEMGIGNTTTSTAMACAFTGMGPTALTGPGTGLSAEGVRHKAAVIQCALDVNDPHPHDPLDVLSKLGGFDIAAMCGLFLGGATYRVPVVIDGLISTVAAYCAWRLRPECKTALFASHLSAEPAAGVLLERMGLMPVIHANLCLGEGTGAVCLVPLLDMALNVYATVPTLEECAITSYKVES